MFTLEITTYNGNKDYIEGFATEARAEAWFYEQEGGFDWYADYSIFKA